MAPSVEYVHTNTSNWDTHPPPTAQGHTVDAEHTYVTVSTIRDTRLYVATPHAGAERGLTAVLQR